MKKGSIQIVITLSVVCLLGVLFFQGVWLHHAFHYSKTQFGKDITEAMNNAVAAQQKRFVFKTFHDDFLGDSTGNTRVRIMMKPPDTAGIDFLKIDSVIKVNGHNDTHKYVSHNRHQVMLVGDSFNLPLEHRVGDIVGKIIEEIRLDSVATRISIAPPGMDTLLANALRQKGITAAFDYAIRANGQIIHKSGGFDTGNVDAGTYNVLMYPLHFVSRADELLLQVHNRHSAIIKSVLPILISSVVFTLFIFITFWITIRTILRQKKISTIKNDFINNMTHEFKTPIATMGIAADALREGTATQGQVGHFAAIIKQESQNMNQKVETILQMALLEQQQVKLALVPTDVHLLVQQALAHMALQLQKSGAQVQIILTAPQTQVLADALHLTNVFANVLDNAVKYAGGTPVITVGSYNHNGSIVIYFTDKGIGMTREEQKHVFDKFYRAQSGNVHTTKGFGLGLSYAQEIIRLHNGTIEVESEKYKGTTAKITLPLAK